MTIETLSVLLAASALTAPAPEPKRRHDDAGTQEERDQEDATMKGGAGDGVPPAAREAIRRVAGPAAIKEIEKVTRAGVITYEAEYRADGVENAVRVSAAGDVLESKKEVRPASLPAVVRSAVSRSLPEGVIREAEAVYVAGEASPTLYEIEVKVGRRKRTLRVRPSGEIIEGSR